METTTADVDASSANPPGLRCLVVEVGRAVVAVLTFRSHAGLGAERLTAAEEVVVRGVFDGKSNDAIARERGTSPRTVANQVASAFRKHGVSSRAELVARYLASDEGT